MFGKKKTPVISSIDDLSDARAREIATANKLLPKEIFTSYMDLQAEVISNNGKFSIDTDKPLDSLIKKLFCGAVISYEMTSRKEMGFEDDGRMAVIKRDKSPEIYASLGRYYEGIAKRLAKKEF
ncbi:MAG: hypothetical protein PHH54_01015 [Candidatus Nanoarchaeia archaeon]|nr:hypothetical protein [Candidatus Nanoarchaeia archaeon]MDD5740544.1 hypothetical protein [Candidatus Nanoarchaeia archaeon]